MEKGYTRLHTLIGQLDHFPMRSLREFAVGLHVGSQLSFHARDEPNHFHPCHFPVFIHDEFGVRQFTASQGRRDGRVFMLKGSLERLCSTGWQGSGIAHTAGGGA
ncbi:hypothetical protein L484_017630 [Morus notabilis]|uniref:Uncharacterized protein n=1 Tax=Morus notabilis TaxID=981085 RepID=W9S8I1_9ROSA|nr:hypothetical protein L484_017630 [Morus notabilis]